MKFSVPTNFDDNLILIMDKTKVYEVYGKLPMDFIGGCMGAYTLLSVNKKRLYRHIDCVHKAGLKFNYLLNSVCLGNKEWSISGRSAKRQVTWRIRNWVISNGVLLYES